jgi:hypothetical protein
MNSAPDVLARRLAYKIPGSAQFESPRDAALHPESRRIPFGENMTTRIFSFCFRSPPLIDAVIRTGIPSRQIR